MEKGRKLGHLGEYMRETLQMARSMEKESKSGQTVESMKETGPMIMLMD